MAYGEPLPPGTLTDIMGYIGALGYQTENTLWSYVRNRYYMPSIGRWISRDPLLTFMLFQPSHKPFIYKLGIRYVVSDEYNYFNAIFNKSQSLNNYYTSSIGILDIHNKLIARTKQYQYAVNNPVNNIDPRGLADYQIGYGPRPTIVWDHGFPYNPNAKWTLTDYLNLLKYRNILLNGAEDLNYIPDATRAYRHYLDATGTDLWVDYNRAIRTDDLISNGFSAEIATAQFDIERQHDGKIKAFSCLF